MKTRDIFKKYPQYYHTNKTFRVVKEQNNKDGRAAKMTVRDHRIIKKICLSIT